MITCENHWDRRKLFAARIKLKSCGYKNIYINEDLPKKQSEVFFLARKARQEKLLNNTWTSSGTIILKTKEGVEIAVLSIEDLKKAINGFDPAKYRK